MPLNTFPEIHFWDVHILGRPNPADHLSQMRFAKGEGLASRAGYGDSLPEMFHALLTAPTNVFTHKKAHLQTLSDSSTTNLLLQLRLRRHKKRFSVP